MKYLPALLFLLSLNAWAERPPCYPLINGVHTLAPRHFIGEQGQHVFWACSPRGGEARVYGFSCLHGQCSMAALHAAHTTILQATAKVATANAVWDASIQFDCLDVIGEDSPRGRLCRERDAFLKVIEARQ